MNFDDFIGEGKKTKIHFDSDSKWLRENEQEIKRFGEVKHGDNFFYTIEVSQDKVKDFISLISKQQTVKEELSDSSGVI